MLLLDAGSAHRALAAVDVERHRHLLRFGRHLAGHLGDDLPAFVLQNPVLFH